MAAIAKKWQIKLLRPHEVPKALGLKWLFHCRVSLHTLLPNGRLPINRTVRICHAAEFDGHKPILHGVNAKQEMNLANCFHCF
jgi:hypothetical protein